MSKKLSLNRSGGKGSVNQSGWMSRSSLRTAYNKISRHEKELEKSKEGIESMNKELETRLAEIFFIHEFLKALAASASVKEVTKLIVDGMSGILGAEVSAVYLLNLRNQRLYLKAWHGKEKKYLRQHLTLGQGIVGKAAAKKQLVSLGSKGLSSKQGKAKGFVKEGLQTLTQIAAPLQIKGKVLGVIAVASSIARELRDEEKRRFINVANMSSLALQNALFHDDLERLSITDRLTELYNRGYFDRRLKEELDRAKRYNHVLSIVMLDIDKFKDFNDTFGHLKGDILLRRVARIIRNNTRSSDIVARYGGEEFIIILPETAGSEALVQAERVRRIVEETSFRGDREHPVVNKTISAGVASYPKDAITKEKLVEKADQALYRAKRGGRNRVKAA